MLLGTVGNRMIADICTPLSGVQISAISGAVKAVAYGLGALVAYP
jgi:hypothetical protein